MPAFLKRCLFIVPLWLCVTMAHAGIGAGDAPPDFVGDTRAGDAVHISDMHGKIVVIAFWASWCQYCQKELPILAGLQKIVSPQQLQVVAINRDDHGTFLKLSHKLMKLTPDLVYTFDEGRVSKAYGVDTIPQTLLIDRDGKVAHVHVGYDDSTLDDLANEINSLLATPSSPVAAPSS
jgi:thiol-disulfide isomerase/thioredoxin